MAAGDECPFVLVDAKVGFELPRERVDDGGPGQVGIAVVGLGPEKLVGGVAGGGEEDVEHGEVGGAHADADACGLDGGEAEGEVGGLLAGGKDDGLIEGLGERREGGVGGVVGGLRDEGDGVGGCEDLLEIGLAAAVIPALEGAGGQVFEARAGSLSEGREGEEGRESEEKDGRCGRVHGDQCIVQGGGPCEMNDGPW